MKLNMFPIIFIWWVSANASCLVIKESRVRWRHKVLQSLWS